MLNQKVGLGGVFTVECVDTEGKVKWTDEFHNLVVSTGLQYTNTQLFKGITYTATWYMGLVTGPGAGNTYAAGDTMALHTGWSEAVGYAQSTRPALSFATASTATPSVLSTSAPAVYTVNTAATIGGAFITTGNTKSGTTGTLFSVGNFTVGDRPVVSGDTINVTYTFSANAA